jgi:hypothetical protein
MFTKSTTILACVPKRFLTTFNTVLFLASFSLSLLSQSNTSSLDILRLFELDSSVPTHQINKVNDYSPIFFAQLIEAVEYNESEEETDTENHEDSFCTSLQLANNIFIHQKSTVSSFLHNIRNKTDVPIYIMQQSWKSFFC